MKLFISYSRDDKAWVALLWQALRDENHDAWMDRFIVPASDWWESILKEVEACECFVYVMTPKSIESIYCRAELDYAIALNKPILPLMLKPCTFPQNLSDNRVQYLMITDDMKMDRVLLRIEQGLSSVRLGYEQRKYTQQDAPRPREPKASRDATEALQIAEDALSRRSYEVAIKLFQEVSENGSGVLKVVAAERLKEAQDEQHCGSEYEQVRKLSESPATLELARRAWRAYQATPCAGYDWDNLAEKLRPNGGGSPPPPPPDTPLSPRGTSSGRGAGGEGFTLPAPFAWVEIPGGHGTMKTSESGVILTIPTERYWIAKYPVTNAQFAKFVEAGGYDKREWWTDAGWEQRQKDQWTQPRYWTDSKWNGAEQPVVGVSWYEAVAFCLWLNEALTPSPSPSGRGEARIMLPTEAQWQYAAQGNDGRAYPWGNKWDGTRCNSSGGIGKTTPVRQYEGKGDSPFGVVDMAGNVWEWCLTDYNNKTNDINSNAERRVLRGGSWLNGGGSLRAADRSWFDPDNGGDNYGFRCARS